MGFLECTVCSENFNDVDHKPRLLLCGHTFCTKCLSALIVKKCVICPTCRQKTSAKNGVSDFKANFQLIELLVSFNELKNDICGECEEDLVICYCEECKVSFCDKCEKRFHKRSLNFHVRVSIEDKAISTCETHKKENLSFFCLKCDSPICNICRDPKYGKHSSHEVDLVDNVETMKRKGLQEDQNTMAIKINELQKLSNAVAQAEILLGTNSEKAIELIVDDFGNIQKALEARKTALVNLIKSQKTNKSGKLQSQRSQIADLIASLTILQETMRRLMDRKTLPLLQNISSISTRVRDQLKEVANLASDPCIDAKLTCDMPTQKIVDILQSYGSLDIGAIRQEEKKVVDIGAIRQEEKTVVDIGAISQEGETVGGELEGSLSMCLSSSQVTTLKSCTTSNWKLLYQSEGKYFKPSMFHKQCDDKGPTITVLQAKETMCVFGGYTRNPWGRSVGCAEDRHAFLWTLTSAAKIEIFKANKRTQTYDSSASGPCFGAGRDIAIDNNPKTCYCNTTTSFVSSSKNPYVKTSLCGVEYPNRFALNYIEVFAVQ